MGSLLRSTLNTRALLLGGMRYIRSDAPLALTETEIRWLLDQHVTTLVDLRSVEEVTRKPCPLQHRAGFTYHHLPVPGGGDTPKSRAHLHAVYRGMVDAQMTVILHTILHAPENVMYFCTAGKDRTGVVSALLLKHLGATDNVIIQDYMASKENLLPMLTAYADQHPEVDMDIIIPREENIRDVLAIL